MKRFRDRQFNPLYTFGMSVQSHSNVAVSWTCRQIAGDASTQNCEKDGFQFTAIKWRETQIHTVIRTFEFNYKI